jgi:hypothetical protein
MSEMGMVERVERALRTYAVRIWGAPHLHAIVRSDDWDNPIKSGFASIVDAHNEAAAMNARAAIEAMREPTDEMEVAGTEQWLCEAAMEDRSGANWRAMIDAALG